jgi:hypothetical protein
MTNHHLQVLPARAALTAAPCLLRAPAVAPVVAVSRRTVDVGDLEDEVGKRDPGPSRQAVDRALPPRVGVEVTPGRILDQFLEASPDLLLEDGDRRPSPLVILEIVGYPGAGAVAVPGQKTHTMTNDTPNAKGFATLAWVTSTLGFAVDFRHE